MPAKKKVAKKATRVVIKANKITEWPKLPEKPAEASLFVQRNTAVYIEVKNGRVTRVGWAKCHPGLDDFDTVKAEKIAKSRAYTHPMDRLFSTPVGE